MVACAKKALKHAIGSTIIGKSKFDTFLAQAEHIVNTRPLTYVDLEEPNTTEQKTFNPYTASLRSTANLPLSTTQTSNQTMTQAAAGKTLPKDLPPRAPANEVEMTLAEVLGMSRVPLSRPKESPMTAPIGNETVRTIEMMEEVARLRKRRRFDYRQEQESTRARCTFYHNLLSPLNQQTAQMSMAQSPLMQ
ncbi:unnamed protein product [Caenorhabditis auriculariae]|uniref:Uncharacterized protein n=1 Tax=Caenorhabditis auriculariae TaxID=2777116 RepID=A0A8S1HU30_9PELO|nr:unnamed protein product [Caenorhabditis auriculariae]